MSTTRAELELLCSMAEQEGAKVTYHENEETGHLDAITITGAKSVNDISKEMSLLFLAEKLRPIYGPQCKKPTINLVAGEPVYSYTLEQLSVYGGVKNMLTQKVWNHTIPDGTKFMSKTPTTKGEMETRLWKCEDGDLIEFKSMEDYTAHVNLTSPQKALHDLTI
jgi:hypothetical protein